MLLETLKTAIDILSPTSNTPQLDAERLLAHVLQKPPVFLHTWPEYKLNDEEYRCFVDLVNQRKTGLPVAYLTGFQAFWSLDLLVNESTLIPRPETEHLVEIALSKLDKKRAYQIVDLGTGSGAVGLALAKERPNSQVFATDKSYAALEVAKRNATALNIKNIQFYQGDWFDALPANRYDIIVSNPPYIALNETLLLSPEVHFEPSTALFSAENGLQAISHILNQAPHYLKPNAYLLIEHGFSQGKQVRSLLAKAGFIEIFTHPDYQGHERVSGGLASFENHTLAIQLNKYHNKYNETKRDLKMENMTYSNFRSHLASALDRVSDNRIPILVTRQSGKAAIIMSLEDFNSYEETAYLMSSIKNAERLNRAVKELEKKKGKHKKLIEE